jgi:hypothetical protein
LALSDDEQQERAPSSSSSLPQDHAQSPDPVSPLPTSEAVHSPSLNDSPIGTDTTQSPMEQGEPLGEEEAETSFVTQVPDVTIGQEDEDPITAGSKEGPPSLPDPSLEQELPPTPREDDPGSTHPVYLGSFLARLEIRWNETCKELDRCAVLAEDKSLQPEEMARYRERCAWLQGQERSLREDLRRFTPMPPIPSDPDVAAYVAAQHEASVAHYKAAVAYHETLRAYWSRPPNTRR